MKKRSESGICSPIKVIWICHFSNPEVQKFLRLRKPVKEFAPWISLGIEEAKLNTDLIELHIIAPHPWLVREASFCLHGIHYNFFNPGIPIIGRHWPAVFRIDVFTKFIRNRCKIKKYIKKIHPEIIHIHGAENSYYSTILFDIADKHPHLLTIQGFTSKSESNKRTYYLRKNVETESRVLKKARHFGIRNMYSKEIISKINNTAIFHWHEYFLNNHVPISEETEKKYDIIYFAKISREKGIEDLIKITNKLLLTREDLRVAVVGGGSPEYVRKIKKLSESLNCAESIKFYGFLPNQSEVYNVLLKSRICLLPTYNDMIPGTIIESMLGGIPVIAYRTGGIPEINIDQPNIILVEQGDWNGMAKKAGLLLDDEVQQKKMANIARKYAEKRWDNKATFKTLIEIYQSIIIEKK